MIPAIVFNLKRQTELLEFIAKTQKEILKIQKTQTNKKGEDSS